MNARLSFAVALVLAIVMPSPAPASSAPGVGYFYEQLAPYGDWEEVAPYGWVWSPADVPVGWRPYTIGHWALTDDGPAWVSGEDWGWICFHYGRWTYDPDYGWLWVPGAVWAPSWCAWRHGDGLVGWAPLPPRVGWNPEGGLLLGGFDLDNIQDFKWCFVREHDLFEPRVERFVALQARNVTLVSLTRNITRYAAEGVHVVDRSVDEARARRWVGHPVPRLRIVEEAREMRRGEVRGGEIFLPRPRIGSAPAEAPPPRFRGRERPGREVPGRAPPGVEFPRRVEPEERGRFAPEQRRRAEPERPRREERGRMEEEDPGRGERGRMEREGSAGGLGQESPERSREREELMQRQNREREELQRSHEQELRTPPRGRPTPEELRNRQNREMRSLEEQHGREMREFENRRRRGPRDQEGERERRRESD